MDTVIRRNIPRTVCGSLFIATLFFWVMVSIHIACRWRHEEMLLPSHREKPVASPRPKAVITSKTGVYQNSQWTPRMDVLSVEEAVKYPIVYSVLLNRDSTIELMEPKAVYKVGEDVRVKITPMFKPALGYNHGGDNIRIHMTEVEKGASVSGYVIDHHNGIYTGVLKALWEGECTIKAVLKYTRYEIAYSYHARQKLSTVRHLNAEFVNRKQVAFSQCDTMASSLDGSNGLCNLTKRNSDLPWFCQIPKNTNMTCKEIKYMVTEVYDEVSILARTRPNSRIWTVQKNNVLGKDIKLTVNGNIHRTRDDAKPLCNKYNYSALWEQPSPTGHFYNHHWYPYHCKAGILSHKRCFKNKYFLFYGDSTIRQWYDDLRWRLNCIQSSVLIAKRQKISECQNLIIYYSSHNYPGNTGLNTSGPNMMSERLENLVDVIDQDYMPVVVIHIYFHYTYYQHSVYRQRIRFLRTTLENIIRQRPDAKILIKGPHLVLKKTMGTCDYYGYVYRLILVEELAPLRNKVIYLDEMDISNAVQTKEVHPTQQTVREMVNTMLAYVCD